jgi:hypothetical protein
LLGVLKITKASHLQKKKGITAQALSTLIKEEEAAWCLAGAHISLVAQYGGIPFNPG